MATVSVSTFPEFLSAIAVSGDTVVVNADKWDVSTYAGVIEIQCAEIQGNGVEISGLDTRGSTTAIIVDNDVHISGISFTDIRFGATMLSINSAITDVEFAECDFSGRAYAESGQGCILSSSSHAPDFFRCTFNIEAGSIPFLYGNSPLFRYCTILYRGVSFSTGGADEAFMWGCYLAGECGALLELKAHSCFNVVNCRCTRLSGANCEAVIVNKDRVSEIDSSGYNNFTELSTSEMVDSETTFYKGFPIMSKKVKEWRPSQ